MSKSSYLASKIVDSILGATAFTAPGTVYFGLYSTLPTGLGTGGTEFDGTTEPGYTRVSITNNTTNFPAATGGVKTLGVAVTFPTNSGASSWANAVGFGIWDASTSGNLLGYGALTPVACGAGAAITITSSQTVWTET